MYIIKITPKGITVALTDGCGWGARREQKRAGVACHLPWAVAAGAPRPSLGWPCWLLRRDARGRPPVRGTGH
jgi:hypothetical protein